MKRLSQKKEQINDLLDKYEVKEKAKKLIKKILRLLTRKFKISAMLAIMGVAPLAFLYTLSYTMDYYTLIGPFCATSALIISRPHSEFCKSGKIFGGYMIAVFTVIALSGISQNHGFIAFILVFTVTIFLMSYFNFFHPSAAAVTITDFFISSSTSKILIYAIIASLIMCYFAHFYRKVHEKIIHKLVNS